MKKKIFAAFIMIASTSSIACTNLPGLEGKMMRSKATAGEILVSTMNRLGYGVHARSWMNKRVLNDIQRRYGKRVAVTLIAAELRAAFRLMKNPNFMPYRWAAGSNPHTDHIKAYTGLSGMVAYRNEVIAERDWTPAQFNSHLRAIQIRRKVLDAVNISKFNPQAKILDIWSNHFNVSSMKSQMTHVNYEYALQRESCGSFAKMLRMTAHHPSMLNYLDNRLNTRLIKNKQGQVVSNLNENYGREVVELHTLGTGPITGYDKHGKPIYAYFVGDAHKYDEVLEATKVLSGFRYSWSTFKTEFVPSLHEKGSKHFPRMFGKKVTIGEGYNQSMRFLNLLAGHNRTKWNVCSKLVKQIYGFHPGRGTVAACHKAYGKYGNLSKMYESIVINDVFFEPSLFGRGIKTPTESVFGASRAMGLYIGSVENVYNYNKTNRISYGITTLGRNLYNYGAPTGQFFDHKLMKSSVYVANRIDAFKRIDFGTNLNYYGRKGDNSEKFASNRAKRHGSLRVVDETFDVVSPVFLDVQKKTLRGKNNQFFKKPDVEYKLARPVKTTVLRSLASGAGMRK